jgi:murein L,D-transpeptidase YcbB/YkuD
MLVSTQEATVEGVPIAATALIAELYARRNYEPAWSDPGMVKQLFDQVLRSVEHGLNPDDFHARLLGMRLKPGPMANDPTFKADTEILCTDALARLAITLNFGKLNPADLDPAWTVPPGILRKETLPAIRRDPSYLSRNNMSVVTTSGKIVDPSTIDWAATTKGFPYMIRQEPGPHNALGRVKFMFPNKYMVYLHDTPSKGLFARTERAFSHGCIRTQNPFDLAELLLKDQGWDRARIDQVVASKKNTRVNLENPITVMLLYWTAEADEDGTVFFRKDVYNRDAPIIKGLDAPFRVSLPEGAREAIGYR